MISFHTCMGGPLTFYHVCTLSDETPVLPIPLVNHEAKAPRSVS